MHIRGILKQVSIPGALAAGIWAAWTDSIRDFPGVGREMSDLSAQLDTFIFEGGKNATATLIFFGLLLGWLIYFVVGVCYLDQKKRARLKLAILREEGVNIKNEGLHLNDPSAVALWATKINPWTDSVLKLIAKIDPADAQQFKILDVPGPPRVRPYQVQNKIHIDAFTWHDRRLVLLNDLITKYGAGF